VAVLGLDDYGPIAAGICKCEELAFLDKCQDTLTNRIEGASPEARQKWLERFDEKNCVVCEHSLECYYSAPTCVEDGRACTANDECCGFDGDGGYCSIDGKCVRPALGCVPQNSPCVEAAECCGDEGGVAMCAKAGDGRVCINFCEPSDDVLCPKCCGTIEVPADSLRASICYPGCEASDEVELCDPDAEPATQCAGRACCPIPVDEDLPGLFVYLCVATDCSDQMPDQ